MDKTNWESTYSDYANFSRLVTDAKLAYYLALRYQLKGSTAAATAAVNILNDWATNCKGFLRLEGYANEIPDPNEYLMLIQAYQMANAAELLTNYNGWAAADQTTFKNWMRQTFADVAYLFLSTREDQHYWLNWDLAALNALVSVGVLCDDKALIDYALDYINNGELFSGKVFNSDNALEAILTQKWVSTFFIGIESWCDYRRTGYPLLKTNGPAAENKGILPTRLRYPSDEVYRNSVTHQEALDRWLGGTNNIQTDVWWASTAESRALRLLGRQ